MSRMRIISVVVTCNRLSLLPRALNTIMAQSRNPDFVFVISNSSQENFEKEQEICNKFGYNLYKNEKTPNYSGALNTAVEEIIKRFGVENDIYFATLDDDDEWLPTYLQEIENNNIDDYDLLIGNLLRKSTTENELLTLPENISEKDFLIGNPGICGSNTFIRLITLLHAGCFDEAMSATVDRDFMVRVFQQKPRYKIVNKHLVNQYTDNDRVRITTNREMKGHSLQAFFYKYCCFMTDHECEMFYERVENIFAIPKDTFEGNFSDDLFLTKQDIQFSGKGNYQFIIGFIAGDTAITERIIRQIVEKKIPVDFVVIIDNTSKVHSMSMCEELLQSYNITHKIVRHNEWKEKLAVGDYGSNFKSFSAINSIPLGRTILHYHLFIETESFKKPVYWIIDDDISFSSTVTNCDQTVNLFTIINQHLQSADGIIGSISNDPPVPVLSCIRGQLVDFLHSYKANNSLSADNLKIREKPDYYYDLSDIHSDHLEMPIYHKDAAERTLRMIFSGKSVSRPALQKELKATEKTISRRGANTLVFNRDLLHYYPVINLEVNNQFARRGDLLWALFNQVVSEKKILEHSFSLDHNRPQADFFLNKELEKSAYDIIGYAFNKAILKVVNKIKGETSLKRPSEIFEKFNQENYYNEFLSVYYYFLERRKVKFMMNYYRIIGLMKLLSRDFSYGNDVYSCISKIENIKIFTNILLDAQKEEPIKKFLTSLVSSMLGYSYSITKSTENNQEHKTVIEKFISLNVELRELGCGTEGVIFTDGIFVYKSFYNITIVEWNFLKTKALCFEQNYMFEKIEFFESGNHKFIRYPFHEFMPLYKVDKEEIVLFLKFCKSNDFVFTNIKPKNFIQTLSGQVKLIDYGKSIESYSEEKLLNVTKRAYLLWKYPTMENDDFQKLTAKINIGEIPDEIKGWEVFYYAVLPRTKEEILDAEVIEIVKKINPKCLLDYGAGKCKTAKIIKNAMNVDVFVYDIDTKAIEKGGQDFPKYQPNDKIFDGKFDCVLLNIVLCVIDNPTMESILFNVSKTLVPRGKVIVSVCNPDFAHVHRTEFQNRDFLPKDKSKESIIIKTCVYTGNKKTEYHRPTEKYIEVFARLGFVVKQAFDTDGVDFETFEFASDFKIFVLEKL